MVLREVVDSEVADRELVDREVEGVSHIGAGIILSASCSFALFCFMFKVVCLLFQFMVRNLTEVSVCT